MYLKIRTDTSMFEARRPRDEGVSANYGDTVSAPKRRPFQFRPGCSCCDCMAERELAVIQAFIALQA